MLIFLFLFFGEQERRLTEIHVVYAMRKMLRGTGVYMWVCLFACLFACVGDGRSMPESCLRFFSYLSLARACDSLSPPSFPPPSLSATSARARVRASSLSLSPSVDICVHVYIYIYI